MLLWKEEMENYFIIVLFLKEQLFQKNYIYKYLIVNHIGPINKIYDTYRILYQKILFNTKYTSLQNNFLHLKKYNYHFHWYKENSIIEI